MNGSGCISFVRVESVEVLLLWLFMGVSCDVPSLAMPGLCFSLGVTKRDIRYSNQLTAGMHAVG